MWFAGAIALGGCGGGGGESTGTSDDATTGAATSTGATGTTVEPTSAGPETTDATSTTVDPTTGAPTSQTTDATTGDATSDATSDATTGAVDPCPPKAFCDDFEQYVPNGPPVGPWELAGGGTVTVDEAKAVSGKLSVKLTTQDGYAGRATMRLTAPGQLPSAHLFGRMRMWLTEASPDGVHWTMIEAAGEGAQDPNIFGGQPFAATLRYGGQHDGKLMANYETPGAYNDQGPSSDCWHHSQTKIPTQAWACMEWEYDATAQTIRFWLDGQAVDDLTVGTEGQGCVNDGTGGKWVYPESFKDLWIGWIDYQSGGGRELWIDDFAVGPERIGCE